MLRAAVTKLVPLIRELVSEAWMRGGRFALQETLCLKDNCWSGADGCQVPV